VLVIGALVSSVLVPWISDKVEKGRIVRQRKHDLALEVVRKSQQDAIRLNGMDTILRDYYRTKLAASRTGHQSDELRTTADDFEKAYRDFNATAWYWEWDIANQLDVDGLLQYSSLKGYKDLATTYSELLNQAARSLAHLKLRLVRGEDVKELAPEINKPLQDLNRDMSDKARSMGRLVLADPSRS